MISIALVRLPFYSLFKLHNWNLNMYPLNLCYLASYLEKRGHKTDLIDAEIINFSKYLPQDIFDIFLLNKMVQKLAPELIMNRRYEIMKSVMTNPNHPIWDVIMKRIKQSKPDLVGITAYTTGINAIKIISKKIKDELGIPIVLGGAHVTAMPRETFSFVPDVDYIVIGEGEKTLGELVDNLDSRRNNFNSIKGLAYKEKNKTIINPARSQMRNLHEIPIPKRDLPFSESYNGHLVVTSRGCPFNCIFCASKVVWGSKVRFRSIDDIIQELLLLKNKYNAKFIRFVDDTFALRKDRVLNLSKKIIENNLDDIVYSVSSKVDTIDEEMIRALKKMGVHIIAFGVESGSPRILKFIKKKISPKDVITTFELTNKYGIISLAYFMIGHPTETLKDIIMSKELIKKSNPTNVEMNIVSPYPGTELWDMTFKKEINQISNWYDWFHQGQSKYHTTEMSCEEINKLYKKLVWFSKFFYFKNYLKNKFKNKNKAESQNAPRRRTKHCNSDRKVQWQ